MIKLKIIYKLPLIIMSLVFFSVLFTGSLAINKAKKDAIFAAKEKLVAIEASRKEALKIYLDGIDNDLFSLADNNYVRQAALDFSRGWDALGHSQTHTLQQSYIYSNNNPYGSKDNLDYSNDGTLYSQQHKKHHPWFRRFLRKHGYYDIFLFDPRGNLIYTVFKELDFATNINTGEWHDTDLGKVFRAAKLSKKPGEQFFADFKAYAPSKGAPASFLSQPILNDDGTLAAVIVFQMPILKLNKVMQVTAGLGKTGETYLVGEDGYMRTDSIFSTVPTVLKTNIASPIIKKALSGKEGIAETQNINGIESLAAYGLLTYHGQKWAIIAEVTKKEILEPINKMQWYIYFCMFIITLISGLISFFVSRGLTKPIEQLTYSMKKLSEGETDFIISSKKGDEIADMGKALEIFRSNRIMNHHYKGQISAINESLAVIEFDMDGTILNANVNFL